MKRVPAFSLFLAAVLAGCSSVRNALEAQALAEDGITGENRVVRTADLSGMGLEELVAFAISNRPSVVSARLAVDDTRLQMREIASGAPLASSTPWNAADVSARLGYSESSPATHFEDLGSTKKGKMTGSLSLDLLVWDFGRNDARKRAQAQRVVAAELSLAEEGYAVFEEVSARYFALLLSEALCDVARSNLVQRQEHLQRAEDMFELGEAKSLDVLRAKTDLAEARESLVAASNDVAVAGANLTASLGLDSSSGGYRSVFGERQSSLGAMERSFAATTFGAAGAYELARTNAPAVMVARKRLAAASAEVDYAMADLMPSLSASLSMNWTDPLWYWRWGLDAAQSLFTGWRKTVAVDRAVVAMESAEAAVLAAEQELSRKIEIAVAERDNALVAEKAAMDSVKSAKENLDTIESQYDVGEVSRIEFSEAVSSYAAALGNRVKAFYRGQTAEAALFALLGETPVYEKQGKGQEE